MTEITIRKIEQKDLEFIYKSICNLQNEVFGADLNPVDDSFNLIIETDLRMCKVSYEISTYRYN